MCGGRIDFPHDDRPPSLNDYLGNVRAALAWCFAGTEPASAVAVDPDRARLCIDLAAASIPLLLELSLLNECYQWSAKALALLDDTTRGSRHEMVLQEARAISAMWTRGNGDDVRAAIARGLEIARKRAEPSSILRLLVGLHMFLFRIGDFRSSRSVAEELATVAPNHADESYVIIADWLRGASEHFIGNQSAARRHFEAGFSHAGPRNVELFGLDYRVRALVPYARVLWLSGSPDRAKETARQAIGEAARLSKPLNVCFALLYTAPVFLWCGDYVAANDVLEQLAAHPNWRALPSLHATALALQGELLLRRGELEQGIALLTPALQATRSDRQNILRARAACALAEALAAVGRLDQARSVVDEAMAEIPAGEEPSGPSRAAAHQVVHPARDAKAARSRQPRLASCDRSSARAANRPRAGSYAPRWRSLAFERSAAPRASAPNARDRLRSVHRRLRNRRSQGRQSSCSSQSRPSSRQARQEPLARIAEADGTERLTAQPHVVPATNLRSRP